MRFGLYKTFVWPGALTLVCVIALTEGVQADDGVIEINQLCAEQSGCFSGDSAGFPVTIIAPGSYKLTSNLDFAGEPDAENLNAIRVLARDVSINLNGFQILGPVMCTGDPVSSCTPTATGSGSGYGVDAVGSGAERLSLTNGQISGAGFAAVRCSNCRIESVSASSNGSFGFLASNSSIVRNNQAFGNGGAGISCGSGVCEGNVAKSNGGAGISCGNGVCESNTARGNGDDGFVASSARVIDNTARENGGNGFACTGCTMIGNESVSNAEWGFRFSSFGASAFNSSSGNGSGDFTGSPAILAPSSCGGAVCP